MATVVEERFVSCLSRTAFIGHIVIFKIEISARQPSFFSPSFFNF
jgi:hypothetical protein